MFGWRLEFRLRLLQGRLALHTGFPHHAAELAAALDADATRLGVPRYAALARLLGHRARARQGLPIDPARVESALDLLDTYAALESWWWTGELPPTSAAADCWIGASTGSRRSPTRSAPGNGIAPRCRSATRGLADDDQRAASTTIGTTGMAPRSGRPPRPVSPAPGPPVRGPHERRQVGHAQPPPDHVGGGAQATGHLHDRDVHACVPGVGGGKSEPLRVTDLWLQVVLERRVPGRCGVPPFAQRVLDRAFAGWVQPMANALATMLRPTRRASRSAAPGSRR